MTVALYARVSTDDKDQDPETQLLALREYCEAQGIPEWEEYVDQASAKDYVRRLRWAELHTAIRQRKVKLVLVWKLDRAWRSVRECLNDLEEWEERGCSFRSITQEVLDTSVSMGKFVLQVMAATAELESAMISERVRAGMGRAVKQGRSVGRPSLRDDPTLQERFADILPTVLDGTMNRLVAAETLGISPRSLGRMIREEADE